MSTTAGTPFHLEIRLRTGVISRGGLSLEGILAAELFNELGDPENAWNSVPIERAGGIPRVSHAIVTSHSPTTRTSFIGGLRPAVKTSAFIGPNRRGVAGRRAGALPDVSADSKEFGNIMSERDVLAVPAVHFLGVGDIAAIRLLLDDVRSIGARRNAGHGAIAGFAISRVHTDRRDHGLLSRSGRLLRTIPLSAWDQVLPDVSPDGFRQAMITWKTPRWLNQHQEPCAVPDMALPVLARGDLRREVSRN